MLHARDYTFHILPFKKKNLFMDIAYTSNYTLKFNFIFDNVSKDSVTLTIFIMPITIKPPQKAKNFPILDSQTSL